MVNNIQGIIDEINEQTEREIQDIANSCAEADFEAVPDEIKTPYDHKATTAFKQSRYEVCLTILRKSRLIVDFASIVINKVFRKRKNKTINIVYENSLQDGVFEKVLVGIYSRKIRNGSIKF